MAPKKASVYKFPDPIANAELVGHDGVAAAFLSAWNGRDHYPMHPVWMLAGPRGIGKATLGYRIARFVFKNQNNEPGGLFGGDAPTSIAVPEKDDVFQKMLVGGFGDFFVIDLEHNIDKDGKLNPTAKQISVHSVRKMIERMQLSSMEGAWRVVLIDSLDEMTTAAQNAILKLLEEPPAQTLFLVVVHSLAATLPTIRSRSRVEKMRPLSDTELYAVARMFLPAGEQDLSPALIKLATGSFGKIANLKRSGGDELYERLIKACENKNANAADLLALAQAIAKDSALFPMMLDAVAHFGLAEIYPAVAREIAAIDGLHLEPEVAIFRIINQIRRTA